MSHQTHLSMLGTYARSIYSLLAGMSIFKGQWQQQPSLKQHLHALVPYFSAGRLTSGRAFLGLPPESSKHTSPIKNRSAKSSQADCSILSYSSAHLYGSEELANLTEGARDTIVALSSGSGRAGVAVIRVSGPSAGAVTEHGMKDCTSLRSNLVDAICLVMPEKFCGVQMLFCRGS